MRSNFFKEKNLKTAIKITDRVTAGIVCVAILSLFIISAYAYVERKFIYPLAYQETVFKYSNEYSLDKPLVFAIIKVESGFNKNAHSNRGAVGLMQITPTTAEYIAKLLNEKDYNLKDEKTNIRYGCYYLRYLLNKFIKVDTALCAYNAGEGRVDGWLKNKEYSDDGISLFNIPFAETKEYINKINKSYKKYSLIYQNILDK